MKRILCLAGVGIAVIAFAAGQVQTKAVAQERIKLRQGIKVEIGGKIVSSLGFGHFTESLDTGIGADGTPFTTTSHGFTGELGTGEKSSGLYQLAHDIATGKNGSTNRFNCTLTFMDSAGRDQMMINYLDSRLVEYRLPSSEEIKEGQGVGVEVSSPFPPRGTERWAEATYIWDSRSQVWNALRCSLGELDTSEVVEISSVKFRPNPRDLGGPFIPSDITLSMSGMTTNIVDVRSDIFEGSPIPRRMVLNYSSNDGHSLVADLGYVKLHRLRYGKRLKPDEWEADFSILGPLSFGYK